MKYRLLIVAAMLASGLAVACGGEDGASAEEQEATQAEAAYREAVYPSFVRLDEVARSVQDSTAAFDAGETTFGETKDAVASGSADLEDVRQALIDVVPPPAREQAHQSLLDGLQALSEAHVTYGTYLDLYTSCSASAQTYKTSADIARDLGMKVDSHTKSLLRDAHRDADAANAAYSEYRGLLDEWLTAAESYEATTKGAVRVSPALLSWTPAEGGGLFVDEVEYECYEGF